jgi:N utilization substance protein B
MLFSMESTGHSADETITEFWRTFDADPEGRAYAEAIVRGVETDREKLDELITKMSTNWRIERMSKVDRNLLRLATWELRARSDVPRAVILDEAVELAKTFGSESSPSFVNGVLDAMANALDRT